MRPAAETWESCDLAERWGSCGPGGRPQVVFDFTIIDGSIVEIELLADPDRLMRAPFPDLDLYDTTEPSAEALEARARVAEAAARAVPGTGDALQFVDFRQRASPSGIAADNLEHVLHGEKTGIGDEGGVGADLVIDQSLDLRPSGD